MHCLENKELQSLCPFRSADQPKNCYSINYVSFTLQDVIRTKIKEITSMAEEEGARVVIDKKLSILITYLSLSLYIL